MARVSSISGVVKLLALGIFGLGSVTASGNPLSNILTAQLFVRSLGVDDWESPTRLLPPDPSSLTQEAVLADSQAPPEVHETQPSAKVQFRYDEVQPLIDEPTILEDQPAAVPPTIPSVEPSGMQLETAPAIAPVVVSNPTVDPFFGGVVQLLGARPDQSFLPVEAIRPPAPPQVINGQSLVASPMGTEATPLTSLPMLPAGDVLEIQTQQAGTEPGRAVLFADGRALLLPIVDWNGELVKFHLPPLRLQQPSLARVFVARADGVVVDYFDFMLTPRTN